MDHEADAPRHVGHQRLRLDQRGRERLLAQHGETALGGLAHERGMHLARRGDVDGVEVRVVEHACGIGVHGLDAERLRPLARPRLRRIGDRDHAGARAEALPARQVMLGDPAGADQADTQRCAQTFHGDDLPPAIAAALSRIVNKPAPRN